MPTPGSTLDNAYAKGEIMKGADGTEIRVLGVTSNAWLQIRSEDPSNTPPSEGNQFFMIAVEVANPPDASRSVDVNQSGFSLISNNWVVYTPSDSCGAIPDAIDQEISPSGRVEGNICFEIPEDAHGIILIHAHGENRRFLRMTD